VDVDVNAALDGEVAPRRVALTPFGSLHAAPPPSTSAPPLPLGTLRWRARGILHRSTLCASLAGNPLPLLTITDFASGPAALAARP
jgi:hypothetical protein